MATAASNNRKYLVSTAIVMAVAVGAYGVGRVYPPLGETAGTIAPSERYVAAQVGENDVTLGDTSVAELMQTDAFEVMVKDPNFRALANDPGFAALARNSSAMAAMVKMSNTGHASLVAATPRCMVTAQRRREDTWRWRG